MSLKLTIDCYRMLRAINRPLLLRRMLTRVTGNVNTNNNTVDKLTTINLTSEQIYTEAPMKILTTKGYTFMLLNGDLEGGDALARDNFQRFLTQSVYRVAVDGGANQLNDLEKGSPAHYIPHTIIGDMDSADSEVRGHLFCS